MNTIIQKTPNTKTDVHPLIQKRWSPRAFAERLIDDQQMEELFEAASWAASAFNEQPWRYVYAHRGTQGFEQLLASLALGNQSWAKQAAVLAVSLQKKTYSHNGKTNHWASHDTGMANAQLLLQAADRDIYGHLMAGFNAQQVKEILALEADLSPVCMLALGYLGTPESLPESLQKRELSSRSRRPVDTFVRKI